MSFKIGDRVEFIDNRCSPDNVIVGDTGIITYSDEKYSKVKLDRSGKVWITMNDRIKLYNTESRNPYDASVKELKLFYDSLIKFGFPEKRAWSLIRLIAKENIKNI